MNKYNIIWMYVDSVRRYHSDPEAIKQGDDRSRLKFMDEFSKESIECCSTVTSAPSTQMSISAMAASLPSYFLANNFSDFFNDTFVGGSLINKIKKEGYNIYGFIQSKRSREFNLKLFTHISRKYWPKGFSHINYWNNSDINKAIDVALNKELSNPAFYFLNFNCRKDPDISDKVKWTINRFKKAGYTKKNTITIICSDHGYPDYSKETGHPEYYIKHNLSHDLILTDDNIMIPLFIQYPSCPEGKKINTTVSSLDIFPTIFDILDIDINQDILGRSLLPLFNNENQNCEVFNNRYFRTDSRLKQQSGRGTSIRNNTWKYVFYYDNIRGGENEEFFNIIEDHLEENNLINSDDNQIQKTINKFKRELQKSEDEAKVFHNEHQYKLNLNSNNLLFKAKREILFAWPFLKQEPTYVFYFIKDLIKYFIDRLLKK